MSHESSFRNMSVEFSDPNILFWTLYQENVHLYRIKFIKVNKTDKEFTVQNIITFSKVLWLLIRRA